MASAASISSSACCPTSARPTGAALLFFGLGYGARLLQPIFARPAAWRVLDAIIAVVMTAIALGLLSRLA